MRLNCNPPAFSKEVWRVARVAPTAKRTFPSNNRAKRALGIKSAQRPREAKAAPRDWGLKPTKAQVTKPTWGFSRGATIVRR